MKTLIISMLFLLNNCTVAKQPNKNSHYFTTIPTEIGTPFYRYSDAKNNFETQKYIVVGNLETIAIMIDNEVQFFKIKNREAFINDYKKGLLLLQNEGYEVEIKYKTDQAISCELWLHAEKITIKN